MFKDQTNPARVRTDFLLDFDFDSIGGIEA